MTTNFALSLSFDGIRLFQRVEDGWHLVGETEIGVPDLSDALAALKAKALTLDPSGLRTKLLIPNEQIKYLSLETAQTSLEDVMSALDGATPYKVNELVVDFDRTGGRTYIAAVARETLKEAESFAKEHHFNPVSFAAIAEPMTFGSEVFFGPTSTASKAGGKPIVRDATPFVVTGAVKLPEPEVAEEDEEPVLFTPRTRMATPESVAEPENETPATDAVEATVEAPKNDSEPEKSAPTLAVPTGTATGPAIVAETPDDTAKQTPPVVAKMREPTISPVIQRTPKATTPVAVIDTPKPAPDADEMASIGGFSSRRAAPAADPRPQEPKEAKPTRAEKKAAAISSKQAQTPRKKPRFLGLILTAILLVVMALVALWASTLSEEDLANWFGINPNGVVEVAQTEPDPNVTDVIAVAPEADVAAVSTATPTTEETPATALPQVRAENPPQILSPAEADRIYAATGVWQRAPRFPLLPRSETFDAMVVKPSDEPTELAAATMPDMSQANSDFTLLAPINPPAPGTNFALDARGLVIATPDGAVTPQGAIVFAGKPAITPPARPAQAAAADIPEASSTPDGVILVTGRPSKVPPLRPANAALPEPEAEAEADIPLGGVDLAGIRPTLRPDELAPVDEVAAIVSDPALAGFRPQVRPEGLAPEVAEVEEIAPEPEAPATPDITAVVAAIAEAAPASPFVNPTARAVRTSSRPDPRPSNFARVVSRATDLANRQAANAAAASAAVATSTADAAAPTTNVSNSAAAPSGNTPTSVARAATLESAIKLRSINLIGVYGQPNNRRALIRLGNGRYVKVEIGSSLDGGRVTAIGDNALNYVKRGKTYALQLPTG